MISRSVDKKIDFDFEIVKSKSKDNPVFYIQYAYARCMSLISIYEKTFNTSLKKIDLEKVNLSNLILNEEIIMIIKICNYFNVIMKAAKFYGLTELLTICSMLQKTFMHIGASVKWIRQKGNY